MNEIKMYLKSDGTNAEIEKDFNLYKGCYHNAQISVYVPKELLYSGQNAESGVQEFTNAVKIGAILTSPSGKRVITESYYMSFVSEKEYKGKSYAVYTRLLPKEFTVYEGEQDIVANVINIDQTDATNPKFISVTTSQTAELIVNESGYGDQDEPIEADKTEELEGRISGVEKQAHNNEVRIDKIEKEMNETYHRAFILWGFNEGQEISDLEWIKK